MIRERTINPTFRGLSEWVALDLETTGLAPDSDRIIEVGAVRFTSRATLGEYQSYVNPGRQLTRFIRDLTGIAQRDVDSAPAFSEIAPDLAEFTRGATVIAHNAPFDLGFLRANGLALDGPVCDTWELAYLARPRARSYTLQQIAAAEAVEQKRAHRALDDARAVRNVFLALTADFAELDPAVADELRRLSQRSGWRIGPLLDSAQEFAPPRPSPSVSIPSPITGGRQLSKRLAQDRPLRAADESEPIDAFAVVSALSAGSPFAAAIPGFEERPQQIEMAEAVAAAIDSGGRLIVEAGTGVGKSLAYLLPAALYATANHKRVIVSTNTINLQEQLIEKDLPMVKAALAAIDPDAADELRFTQLKGRANYLCYKRWRQMRTSADIDPDQARLIAKTLMWMPDTHTGDRAEINLGHRSAAAPWDRISAQRARQCPDQTGPCFLRAAREKALASHIVVVNHALLMSDLASGGNAVPDYDVLIIDEAHHLEDAATDQLGFSIGPDTLADLLAELVGERGLLAQCASEVSQADPPARETAEQAISQIGALAPRLREEVARLFVTLIPAALPRKRRPSAFASDIRVTERERAAPEWAAVESAWKDFDILMADFSRSLDALDSAMDSALDSALDSEDDAPDNRRSALVSDLGTIRLGVSDLRRKTDEFLASPSEDMIYWTTQTKQASDVRLNAAPLHVGDELHERLYADKEAVVMTSATLSAGGSFDHVQDRLGFFDSRHIALGSPFDFYESALLYTPRGIPAPSSPEFQDRAHDVIADAATAAEGRTMALFTSHSALRAAASAIRARMSRQDIQVLAQGMDGPPQLLAARFLEQPRSVLLGTSSFWEGVDFAGDALTVLIVTRLPFSVPTDPVFEARSEQYANSFMEYAVPQAAIRFKQGFGRLIRTSRDRGVAIVLDSRIVTRRYGRQFIESLPDMRLTDGKGATTAHLIDRWMERPA